jgi:hypothetical protein
MYAIYLAFGDDQARRTPLDFDSPDFDTYEQLGMLP